jgi:hypothetical protein
MKEAAMQRSYRQQFRNKYARASSWLPAVSLVAGLTFWAGQQDAHAAEPATEPFKFTNIHFETNASACDMGIQILFDTDGVTELSIEGPNDVIVFSSWTPAAKRTPTTRPKASRSAWSRQSGSSRMHSAANFPPTRSR